jgi:putative endonuclease
MVGLGPTTHEFGRNHWILATCIRHHKLQCSSMQGGWVYIMSNRPNGTLYVGVTSELAKRAWEHRTGAVTGFTTTYGLKRLVYFEAHETIEAAIRREKAIKSWLRAWKVRLITASNPDWVDLYETL